MSALNEELAQERAEYTNLLAHKLLVYMQSHNLFYEACSLAARTCAGTGDPRETEFEAGMLILETIAKLKPEHGV